MDRLNNEQRARVGDCLRKAPLSLSPDHVEGLIQGIEASIRRFRAAPPTGSFRDAHDALRALWKLSHDDDPAIGLLRARLGNLPAQAIEHLGRRARAVIPRLFPGETIGDEVLDPPERLGARLLQWAASADGHKLVVVLRAIITAQNSQIVRGRSRGSGKRSKPRVEPVIMGEVRGAGGARDKGGRPERTVERDFVMYLAVDWLQATGEAPNPGRSDATGFGDLVHSAFQWLGLDDESATYALRRYWAEVGARAGSNNLADFLET